MSITILSELQSLYRLHVHIVFITAVDCTLL